MSESGFPSPPASRPPLPENTARPADTNAPNARLIGAPEELRETRVPVKLSGEVVRSNEDGTVRIRTPRGDVDIQVPPKAEQPRQGDQIDIVIVPARTAGKDSTGVILQRPAAQPSPPIPAQQTQVSGPSSAVQAPRGDKTPVNIEITAASPQLPAIQTDDIQIVRLKLIETAEAVALIAARISVIETALPGMTQSGAPLPQMPVTALPATLITAASVPLNPAPATLSAQIGLTNTAATPDFFAPPPPIPLPASAPPALSLPDIIQPPAVPPAPEFQDIADMPVASPPLKTALPVLPPDGVAAPQDILQAPRLLSVMKDTPATLPAPAAMDLPRAVFQAALNMNAAPPALSPRNLFMPDVPPEAEAAENTLRVTLSQRAESFPAQVETRLSPTQALLSVPPSFTGNPADPFFMLLSGQNMAALESGSYVDIIPLPYNPVSSAAGAAAASLAQPLPPLPVFLMPGAWPVMDMIQQSLMQYAPQLAQAMTGLSPSPAAPGNLPAAALFFLAAVRSGDIGSWLGEKAIEALRRDGRGGLLSRLSQEGAMLSRAASDATGQDWRAFNIPIFWDGDFSKIALYTREDGSGDGEENGDKGKQTRFVFDLRLSAMGPAQIDGLLRGKRLDIILRTQESLSEGMRADMRAVYTGALKQSDMQGELSFQNRPEQWVTVDIKADEGFGTRA